MKNLKFLLIITSFYSCYGFWGSKEPQYATKLHEMAEICDFAHAKCSYQDIFRSSKVDPATKDSKGLTARQVAEKKSKTAKTEWGKNHCQWVMEELEIYEEWYRESKESS